MFNPFKAVKNTARQIQTSFKEPREIIAEIHNEFDTSTERLLNEAKEILSKKRDTAKGERLKSIGFIQSKEAVAATEEFKKQEENEKLASAIDYFQQWYPDNKFITENEVSKICKKYGLVFGEVEFYKGDVPEKNLIEIEQFKLKDEDGISHPCAWLKYVGDGRYGMGSKNDGRYGYISVGRWGYNFFEVAESIPVVYTKPELKICATVSDFDTRNMRITEGYKLELNLPDPIVLQPVKGGYLIVSKWGLEASDENVVNEKMN